MLSHFGSLLNQHLAAKAMSVRAFGRAVEVVPSHVQRIIAGDRLPPLDALPSWADVLALTGKDRERFILLGQLAHAPEEVRAYVAKLEGERKRRRSN